MIVAAARFSEPIEDLFIRRMTGKPEVGKVPT
jgi:hypothetical protein